MTTYEIKHSLGDAVVVDGQLEGTVVAVRFYTDVPEYLVAWFCNGDAKSDWFAHWRLVAS